MKKILKFILRLLTILILFVVAFYFWGSSSFYSKEKYKEIKLYNSEVKNPNDTLRVMSYNIGWLSGMTNNLPVPREESMYKRNLKLFKNYLLENDIDLIGFQEIDLDANRSFNYNQLDSICQGANYYNSAMAVNWDKKYVPFPYTTPQYYFGKILSGQAIISKYKIASNDFTTLIKPLAAPFFYNKFYLDRLIQKSVIEVGGKNITVLNVHLEAFDEDTRSEHLISSIQAIKRELKNGPLIFMGDLNSPQEREGRNKFLDELINIPELSMAVEDSIYNKNPEMFYTFSTGEPVEKIDYIFYSNKDFKAINAKVVTELNESSDHYPVLIELVLK